jgi:Fic family protein
MAPFNSGSMCIENRKNYTYHADMHRIGGKAAHIARGGPMSFVLEPLPPRIDLETKPILKRAAAAHRYLAELKGASGKIPNQGILINTLALQEAKDSSAIENIVTTHDELYREEILPGMAAKGGAKEVRSYANALRVGYEIVTQRKLLTSSDILRIQEELEKNQAGFRKLAGTSLVNDRTGEVVYTPPQDPEAIVSLMSNLERFINDDTMLDLDPLVKMAIVHFQFESIHPFYDGNGRTGRIINVLYLVLKGLLDIPVLYLSRYFIQTKNEYYRLLQAVRDSGSWEEWTLYVLEGIERTSRQTISMVEDIAAALMKYKHRIRADFPSFYSQDLINNLFFHPYTKIDFLKNDLGVSRLTATKYLDALAETDLLSKRKVGRSNYYVNTALYGILTKDYSG